MELTEIQISFVWAETIIGAFEPVPGAQPPLRLLNQRTEFIPFFENAQQQPVAVGGELNLSLHPPWRKPTGQRFWQSYLDQEPSGTVNGKRAWRSLVPLRTDLPVAVTAPSGSTQVQFEAFFYPYGIALLGVTKISGQLSWDAALDEAFNVWRGYKFKVEWPSQPQQSMSLQQIAEQSLMKLRNWGWGNKSAGRRTALDPFTIFSITQGHVEDAVPVTANSEIHRALEGVTGWRANWKTDTLPTLESARVSAHAAAGAAPATDWLYGRKRARALWVPSKLGTTPGGYGLSLECYHHNLSLASLQVESLCGFARETVSRLEDQTELSFYENECARNAAGLLTRLYVGDDSVYRSWSVRSQIDQNNFRGTIDSLRSSMGLPPMT